MPYQPRPLERLKLGVQRLDVICPVEMQCKEAENNMDAEETSADGMENLAAEEISGDGDGNPDAGKNRHGVEKNLVAEEIDADAQKILVAEERTS